MENTLLEILQHEEYRQWMSELNFYRDEIKFFQTELLIVVGKHTDLRSIEELVEEYKGLFLKKLTKIDRLRHDIMSHDLSYVNSESCDENHHQQTKEEMEILKANFTELKSRFKRFASHND